MSNQLVSAADIRPGMTLECFFRTSVGDHVGTVTHVDDVGTHVFRRVVSLSCGHTANLSGGHGMFLSDSRWCPECDSEIPAGDDMCPGCNRPTMAGEVTA